LKIAEESARNEFGHWRARDVKLQASTGRASPPSLKPPKKCRHCFGQKGSRRLPQQSGSCFVVDAERPDEKRREVVPNRPLFEETAKCVAIETLPRSNLLRGTFVRDLFRRLG
jgi:hypothetical protein